MWPWNKTQKVNSDRIFFLLEGIDAVLIHSYIYLQVLFIKKIQCFNKLPLNNYRLAIPPSFPTLTLSSDFLYRKY